jgi:hypothetical protein
MEDPMPRWPTHPFVIDPVFRGGTYGMLACSSVALLAFYLFAVAHAYRPGGGGLPPAPVAAGGDLPRTATPPFCRALGD